MSRCYISFSCHATYHYVYSSLVHISHSHHSTVHSIKEIITITIKPPLRHIISSEVRKTFSREHSVWWSPSVQHRRNETRQHTHTITILWRGRPCDQATLSEGSERPASGERDVSSKAFITSLSRRTHKDETDIGRTDTHIHANRASSKSSPLAMKAATFRPCTRKKAKRHSRCGTSVPRRSLTIALQLNVKSDAMSLPCTYDITSWWRQPVPRLCTPHGINTSPIYRIAPSTCSRASDAPTI